MERRKKREAEKDPQKVAAAKSSRITADELPTEGETISAVAEMAERLRDAYPDEYWRFSADIASLHRAAQHVDSGSSGALNSYRQILDKLNTRIDRIFGASNLDMTARLQKLIDDNVHKRVEQGWDA